MTYLLISPSRSSICGHGSFSSSSCVSSLLQRHDDAVETRHLKPWRVAELKRQPNEAVAAAKGLQVSRQSGFRARLMALRQENHLKVPEKIEVLPIEKALDALTYVEVEFCSPKDTTRCVKVLALVDTGSNDCDLKGSLIEELRLPIARRGGTSVETAANRVVEISIFQAKLKVLGREAIVEVSPADEDYAAIGGAVSDAAEDDVDKEFGLSTTTDEAVIGADALASLGLIVDCKHRRLLTDDGLPKMQRVGASPRVGRSHCIHVNVRFSNPMTKKEISVKALVDSGSTDVDLQQSKINALDLVVDESEIPALFETAGGVTTSAPIYWATAQLGERRAPVRLSPSLAEDDETDSDEEEEEDSDESTSTAEGDEEEALLGHDALAALNILVDCKNRCLLLAPEKVDPHISETHSKQGMQKRRRRERSGEE